MDHSTRSAALRDYLRLEPRILDELCEPSTYEEHGSGHAVLSGGEYSDIFVLLQGTVRYWMEDAEGCEVTKVFVSAPDIVGSTRSKVELRPSAFHISAVDDVQVLRVPCAHWQSMIRKHHSFALFVLDVMERVFLEKEEREHSLYGDSADQRYDRFISSHRAIIPLLAQRTIATYLNIAPESLSRLRRKRNG